MACELLWDVALFT